VVVLLCVIDYKKKGKGLQEEGGGGAGRETGRGLI